MATTLAKHQQRQWHQSNDGNASVLDERKKNTGCDMLPVIFGGCGI
jgi:hypothetical protein